ncbi:lipase [Paracoccus sp. P2]|uniref:Lipase n=1 Tax=Paracoccus pantotrophus TaxID=82367 RepID=A0A7H9BSJ7_PARPN|nr:lipase [Paracoccus pantotrophus]MDF3854287.1 lipase [Paracoccus pantotrophus]QLH13698.1 lipase [Paracoccus pantotrophus]RDE00924.1 lipase [Paracoccus pantotrophus]RNI17723.1 lipase [Paracoccus pantotrophus]WGR67139.1 lipase [Paracoccus pantotrophus]
MGAIWTRRIGAAVLVAALGAGTAFLVWPEPPRPATPVPTLSLAGDAGFQAELGPPRPGWTALPAQATGRAAPGPAGQGYRHEWPGFHASARFQGTGIVLRFDDAVNRWRVTLDGKAVEVSRPGRRDLHIRGLAPGRHEIRAEKISESAGPALFGGFFLDDSAQALPPPDPAPRLIEFIGDSDTVSFANTASRRDCEAEEIYAATDTSRGFGPQVAAALGADYRIVARSGIGLLRNYGGAEPDRTMDRLYPLALPGQPDAAPLPERKADMVVIGLGSNVFGSELAPGERWSDKGQLRHEFGPALADFAAARAQENPGATLALLAFGEYGPELVEAHRTASKLLDRRGLANRLVVLGDPRRNACLWHPSAEDHAMIAQALVVALKGPDPN